MYLACVRSSQCNMTNVDTIMIASASQTASSSRDVTCEVTFFVTSHGRWRHDQVFWGPNCSLLLLVLNITLNNRWPCCWSCLTKRRQVSSSSPPCPSKCTQIWLKPLSHSSSPPNRTPRSLTAPLLNSRFVNGTTPTWRLVLISPSSR